MDRSEVATAREAVLALLLVSTAWGCIPAAEADPGAQEPAASRLEVENLNDLLEPVREKHELPSLAAVVVHGGEVIARGAVGLRAIGSAEAVTVDDLWHIGSCTKALTSTLIALLVEEEKLSWGTTIAESLPDLADEIRPEYRAVTLEQLLAHRSGLPSDRTPDSAIRSQLRSLPGSMREQRRQLAVLVLQQEPAAPAGTDTLYSNFGYAVAGAIAEVAGDASWEELLRGRVLEPLGMSSAGYGAPGVAEAVTQPRGHREGKPIEPGPMADNPPVIGPAGTVHLSLDDWARFVALHIDGARGESDFLPEETFRRLHTPPPGGDVALGWGVSKWAGGVGMVLTHAGSNRWWFARMWLAPEKDRAILLATNCGGAAAERAIDRAMFTLLRRPALGDR